MSKRKTPKKKVVVTSQTEQRKARSGPRQRTRRRSSEPNTMPLLFQRENYILMGVGVALIALGLILMMGGRMPEPDVWIPERIYSARRTVLAPILIIAGLAIEIAAIFRRGSSAEA